MPNKFETYRFVPTYMVGKWTIKCPKHRVRFVPLHGISISMECADKETLPLQPTTSNDTEKVDPCPYVHTLFLSTRSLPFYNHPRVR